MKLSDILKKTPAGKVPTPVDTSPAPEASAPVPQATMPPEMTCRFCGRHFTDNPLSRRCLTCGRVAGEPGRDQCWIPPKHPIVKPNCVLINLNTLSSNDTLIVVASSSPSCSFAASHRMRRVGRATYESPAFGGMERRKTGDVFCIDHSSQLSDDALRTAAENFHLPPYQYRSANLAFLMQEGSWSNCGIEIVALTGIRAAVLIQYRTTHDILNAEIDRNDFPPRLISLALDE